MLLIAGIAVGLACLRGAPAASLLAAVVGCPILGVSRLFVWIEGRITGERPAPGRQALWLVATALYAPVFAIMACSLGLIFFHFFDDAFIGFVEEVLLD